MSHPILSCYILERMEYVLNQYKGILDGFYDSKSYIGKKSIGLNFLKTYCRSIEAAIIWLSRRASTTAEYKLLATSTCEEYIEIK